MDIKEGVFPGGEFVYKYDVRDYATSMGLAESIGEDLTVFEKDEDLLYSVYLDDPMKMGGTRQRFATGILIDRSGRDKKKQLMDVNKEIRATVNVDDEDASIQEVWKQLEYKSTSLPSLDAAVLQFPFTNGFVSALTLSYKIIPALRKYAIKNGEKGNIPVVISSCNASQQMCTHYAPLVQGKKFMFGNPPTDKFLEALGPEQWIDIEAITRTITRYIPALKRFLG